MKFYIATSLSRISDHNVVRDQLFIFGHKITYDWTIHGSVRDVSTEALSNVAKNEVNGILSSDFIVILLPGGRGTHTELGLAIASNKLVFINGPDHLFTTGKDTCAFYHLLQVKRIKCDLVDLATNVEVNINMIRVLQ